MAGSVYGGGSSGKGAARKVGVNARKGRVPPVTLNNGDRVRAEDISKLFGNQENFNMLKSLLNQSGPGALNTHIK